MIPHTDALPAILKIVRTKKETLALESVFGIIIGGCIGQLEFFKRNATKVVSLDNSPKVSSSFSNILSKMHEVIFLEAFN